MLGDQPGFWDAQGRLLELFARGDPWGKFAATVDDALCLTDLVAALGRRNRSRSDRPAFDAVLKFRMLVLQAMHGLSLAQTEDLGTYPLCWMRLCRCKRFHKTRLEEFHRVAFRQYIYDSVASLTTAQPGLPERAVEDIAVAAGRSDKEGPGATAPWQGRFGRGGPPPVHLTQADPAAAR